MTWTLYTGVHETNPAYASIDLANCPAGAIRLMTNTGDERWARARRCVTVWNSGLQTIPCLKTQAAPSPAVWRQYVREMLDGDPTGTLSGGTPFVGIAPVGGPRKADIWECGNEPGAGAGPGTSAGAYLSYLTYKPAPGQLSTADFIRSRGLKVMLAAATNKLYYDIPGGARITGPAALARALTDGAGGSSHAIYDGFALHNYSDSPSGLVNSWNNQRNLFPIAKFMAITETGWATPWAGQTGTPFVQPCNEQQRINRILTIWPLILSHAEAWNLWYFVYFANGDYDYTGDGVSNTWDERCGLRTLATASGGNAIKTVPGGGAVWNGSFANGSSPDSSWEALDLLPKTTTLGGVVLPPLTPPEVTISAATLIQDTTARLNGTVDANGKVTTYAWEYDTNSGAPYAFSTPATGGGTGTAPVTIATTLTGLSASTTYYARLTATNADGTDVTGEVSFTTAATSSGGDEGAGTAAVPDPLRLQEAVRKSHVLAVRAEVLSGGEVVAEPPIIGGSVTYDSRAAVRATLDLTLVDDGSLEWIPTTTTSPLAPYGNEIRVWRGVHFGPDDDELVSLGIFRIDEVEATDGGEIRISGSDRAATVADATFESGGLAGLRIAGGTLFTDAIRYVVTDALGYEPETIFVDSEIKTPTLVAEEGEDRWEFVSGLAQVLKAQLYWDGDGVLRLEPIPQPTDNPVAEIVEGEGGVLLEASKRWSRLDTFNRVIVTSDADPSVRAVATDDDPLSATYYNGPFGKAVRFWSNQFVTTQAQAQDAAEGILLSQLGVTQQIDFGAVVDPTRRVSDVVLIRRAKLGVSEAHIIDTLTIPLDAESSMTGTTRLVRPLIIEPTPPPDEHLLLSPDTLLFPEQVLF